jgi:hypothetical protein
MVEPGSLKTTAQNKRSQASPPKAAVKYKTYSKDVDPLISAKVCQLHGSLQLAGKK